MSISFSMIGAEKMATRKRKKKQDDSIFGSFPAGWKVGAVFWRDPTLFTEPINEENARTIQ